MKPNGPGFDMDSIQNYKTYGVQQIVKKGLNQKEGLHVRATTLRCHSYVRQNSLRAPTPLDTPKNRAVSGAKG